tara:strand:+ start:152 stop:403 length:252 start_codon:yes stop_codon:yes gene_type:complete
MKIRHHVAIQMEEERQHRIDNGPIVITADQLWKDSDVNEVDDKLIELVPKYRKKYVKIQNDMSKYQLGVNQETRNIYKNLKRK